MDNRQTELRIIVETPRVFILTFYLMSKNRQGVSTKTERENHVARPKVRCIFSLGSRLINRYHGQTHKKHWMEDGGNLLEWFHQLVSKYFRRKSFFSQSCGVRPRLQLILPVDGSNKAAAPLQAGKVGGDILNGRMVNTI
jgi:hypothetical protein